MADLPTHDAVLFVPGVIVSCLCYQSSLQVICHLAFGNRAKQKPGVFGGASGITGKKSGVLGLARGLLSCNRNQGAAPVRDKAGQPFLYWDAGAAFFFFFFFTGATHFPPRGSLLSVYCSKDRVLDRKNISSQGRARRSILPLLPLPWKPAARALASEIPIHGD